MTTTITPDQHYREAIKWIDTEAYAYFVTSILNLGKPNWNSAIPTACVGVPQDGQQGHGSTSGFEYHFNPQFALKLPASQLAFVAAHETLHIVLNHLALSDKYPDHSLFNIAADCVINDYLAQQGFDVPEWVMTGEKQVGWNAADSTVSAVYAALQHRERTEGGSPEAGEAGDTSGGSAGDGSLVDTHEWIHDATAEQKAAAEKASGDQKDAGNLPQEVEDQKGDAQTGNGHGISGGGEGREFFKDGSVTLRWEALIRRINPDAYKRHAPAPSWLRQPPRLIGSNCRLPEYPDVNRDQSGFAEQPALVLALDTSGSIQDEDARRFINLARSIPQSKVKLFPITFTTKTMDLDLDNPYYEGGGTDFGCIEAYIQASVVSQLGHYPKAVVVITDGQAGWHRGQHVEPSNRKSWTWLWTHKGTFNRYAHNSGYAEGETCNFGTAEALSDYTN